MLPQIYNKLCRSTKLHKSKGVDRKVTDRKEINQLPLPGWTLASHGSHCGFFIISYVLYSKNTTQTLMKEDSMALFSQKRQFSCHPRGFNSSWASTELYTSDWFQREGWNWKRRKLSKITRLFSLYQRWTDKLYGQE